MVDSFKRIETVELNGLICTTFTQTVNDMLAEEYSDRDALIQALSNYFYEKDKSFTGLKIKEANIKTFEVIKPWVIDYYTDI